MRDVMELGRIAAGRNGAFVAEAETEFLPFLVPIAPDATDLAFAGRRRNDPQGIADAAFLGAMLAYLSPPAILCCGEAADHFADVIDGVADEQGIATTVYAVADIRHLPDQLLSRVPGPVPLAVLDARHCAARPALDLLRILPALAPGAWVVLAGIDPGRAESRHALRLHAQWPGPRTAAAGIGAIRLAHDPAETEAAIEGILATSWDAPNDARRPTRA